MRYRYALAGINLVRGICTYYFSISFNCIEGIFCIFWTVSIASFVNGLSALLPVLLGCLRYFLSHRIRHLCWFLCFESATDQRRSAVFDLHSASTTHSSIKKRKENLYKGITTFAVITDIFSFFLWRGSICLTS